MKVRVLEFKMDIGAYTDEMSMLSATVVLEKTSGFWWWRRTEIETMQVFRMNRGQWRRLDDGERVKDFNITEQEAAWWARWKLGLEGRGNKKANVLSLVK